MLEISECYYVFSAMCSMSFSSQWGGLVSKPQAVIADLQLLIKSASKSVNQKRPPVNRITFSMLKQSGHSPNLKIKAAESRHMLPALRHILETYFPMNTEHEIQRYQCVRAIDEAYKGMRASDADYNPHSVASSLRQHLILYADLGRQALEGRAHLRTGFLMWRWMPKHHLLSHFEQQILEGGNPAHHWCYSDEAAIGDCVKVAEKSHSNTLHRLVMEKNRIEV